ncbi:MAG: glycoside hydrolase family 43 protein [Spirochaetota bacterium]
MEIRNPILPGFNPDPSICRVGDDYYIATSTFEWFPGVQIHHSRDLVHWRLLTRVLNRVSQLDMRGDPDSGGIWAPCLTHHEGTFYLCYTDVKNFIGIWKDTHNYLVTAEDIMGPWTDPIYLNASGFDPSLFHDDDGKSYLVNMIVDHRKGKNRFGGTLLQEYSRKEKRLIGPVRNIFPGTSLGCTEGPHIYKRNGFYYLMLAEGGTGYKHAVTIARSRSITGPYEVHPHNPILTSANDAGVTLQKAGHASLVETQNGEWYIAHLASRPITEKKRCVLGRETSLQKVVWKDDWLSLHTGGNAPESAVPAPDIVSHPFPAEPVRDDFDDSTIPLCFQSLRVPMTEDWITLTARKGYLRLYGRESLASNHRQSLLARRQQAFSYTAATCLEFDPVSFQQMAGLICYYDTDRFFYLHVSHDEDIGRHIAVISRDYDVFEETAERVPLGTARVFLKADVDHERLQFSYSFDGSKWHSIGPVLDASKLSDDYSRTWGFTGAFVGICCQDLSGVRCHADFDWFEYTER